uniref:Uncharacterized protein n=1 Tax=Tanacetum cinerariifolium TaxID=118510 RepID=A0A6L2JDD5_TANCI|nr:hypothetical protein [Tanacetum cinerariifolium]
MISDSYGGDLSDVDDFDDLEMIMQQVQLEQQQEEEEAEWRRMRYLNENKKVLEKTLKELLGSFKDVGILYVNRFYGEILEKTWKTMQFWRKNEEICIVPKKKDMVYPHSVTHRIKLLQYAKNEPLIQDNVSYYTSWLWCIEALNEELTHRIEGMHVSKSIPDTSY